jgi:LPXTG-motif cell wall-anchored protein
MRKFLRSLPAVLFFIFVCSLFVFAVPIGLHDDKDDGSWMLLAGIALFGLAVMIRKRRRVKKRL